MMYRGRDSVALFSRTELPQPVLYAFFLLEETQLTGIDCIGKGWVTESYVKTSDQRIDFLLTHLGKRLFCSPL